MRRRRKEGRVTARRGQRKSRDRRNAEEKAHSQLRKGDGSQEKKGEKRTQAVQDSDAPGFVQSWEDAPFQVPRGT